MDEFPNDSPFRRQRQSLCVYRGEPTRDMRVEAARVSAQQVVEEVHQEVERWYGELNDIVRSLGTSTTTSSTISDRGAQKRAQRSSSGGGYGSVNVAELHDRLTELRDQIYRHVR